MAHARAINACFPTGLPYPGIAEHLLRAPPALLGLAEEIDVDAPWRSLPLAVIDTETTGRDASRGDRVVELAVVHFRDGAVEARHALLVNPGVPIPAEASAVHGITDDKVRGEPPFEAVLPRVLTMLEGRIPVAYNAGFDRAFLFAEMRRAGRPVTRSAEGPPALRRSTDWLDPLVWARALSPAARGFKLGEVAARLGVELAQAHRATDDAEAAGNVFYALLAGEPTLTYRALVSRQRGYIAGGLGRTWRR
ncbi:MAG: 3'-5' exonuclease [Deltaproteobacteria bacterium]|nr:3'-5' exonuclease [Deltaproteobacteria bacterium]